MVDKKTKEPIKKIRNVSIDQADAEMLNGDVGRTGLLYVLEEVKEAEPVKDEIVPVKEDTEKELRAKLFAQLSEAGVTIAKNAKTEVLQAKVAELSVKDEIKPE